MFFSSVDAYTYSARARTKFKARNHHQNNITTNHTKLFTTKKKADNKKLIWPKKKK